MKVDPPGQLVITFVSSGKESGGTIIARMPTDKADWFEPGKTYEFFGKVTDSPGLNVGSDT